MSTSSARVVLGGAFARARDDVRSRARSRTRRRARGRTRGRRGRDDADARDVPRMDSWKDDDAASRAMTAASRAVDVVAAFVAVARASRDARARAMARAMGGLGPTFVKFGQALASRADVVGAEASRELSTLCDGMDFFDDAIAVRVIEEELGVGSPVARAARDAGGAAAAASLAQVYRATLDGETVAIKVRRPGIEDVVDADYALLRLGAWLVERVGGVRARAVDAVDEFASRLYEEMDFRREASNLKKFDALYGERGSKAKSFPKPGIKVPRLIDKYGVGRRVIVTEWIEGEKLTGGANRAVSSDDLPYVKLGIACTLSQLIETGVMHADPHGGNVLKLPNGGLAYLDFGLVSEVPQQVRDGLVAAVALLIFSRDYAAVGRLFGELMLIPPEVIEDETEMRELERALEEAANATLKFPEDGGVPDVRFDQLLFALFALVPRFKFVLPPYFLNNARALGTLEGMAKSADPNFNILAVVYPYAMARALANPDRSPVIRRVIRQLATDNDTGSLSMKKLFAMLSDVSAFTGTSKFRVSLDALKSTEGRSLVADVLKSELARALTACVAFFRRRGNPPTIQNGGVSFA